MFDKDKKVKKVLNYYNFNSILKIASIGCYIFKDDSVILSSYERFSTHASNLVRVCHSEFTQCMLFEFLESLAFEKELLIFGWNAKLLFD